MGYIHVQLALAIHLHNEMCTFNVLQLEKKANLQIRGGVRASLARLAGITQRRFAWLKCTAGDNVLFTDTW